ncbi:hypothetical protein [Fictibacillus barbaricus]|uniref:ABC transporter permease n=1 Tax=Fictibacillus barbaricus TaxID=182136 RepID=A0ABU1TWL3_9BACL|nr:hypothetical protein [Fictibacillus barbaricus]MDR7071609.1 hypothetical protein [Fictibacillus barbaricus]
MVLDEVKKMRRKQFIVTNALLLTFIIIYFLIIPNLNVTSEQFFLILGMILLIQAIFGFSRANTTKSFFSIFEQVAIYEKEKMGIEWKKQRKMNSLWILITSGLMFLQAYLNRGLTGKVLQIDFRFMFIMFLFVVVLTNISLILHVRKVDRSRTELDMKGYTYKSNVMAIIFGICSGIVFIVFSIFYLLKW